MSYEKKLLDLGINLPEPAAPLASYVPAVRTGNYVYTSGQLPTVNGELIHTGKVGLVIDIESAQECAKTSIINCLAAIKKEIGSLDKIKRVVKLTGFVASEKNFINQPQVINGGSDLLLAVFGEAGKHARSAVGVSELPKDAPVEIELIVELLA